MKTMMIVRSDDDGGSGNFIDLSDIVEPRYYGSLLVSSRNAPPYERGRSVA